MESWQRSTTQTVCFRSPQSGRLEKSAISNRRLLICAYQTRWAKRLESSHLWLVSSPVKCKHLLTLQQLPGSKVHGIDFKFRRRTFRFKVWTKPLRVSQVTRDRLLSDRPAPSSKNYSESFERNECRSYLEISLFARTTSESFVFLKGNYSSPKNYYSSFWAGLHRWFLTKNFWKTLDANFWSRRMEWEPPLEFILSESFYFQSL